MKLKELVDIVGGGTPSRDNDIYWNGSIPWVTVKDMNREYIDSSIEFITEEGLINSSTNLIKKNSILIPTRMGLGRVAINTVDVAINQDLKALVPKNSDVLDLEYLFYFLKSKSDYLKSQGKGATVKGITLDILRELDVPLLSIEIQKQIVKVLNIVYSLIHKRQSQITALDELTQSLFLEMFGNPINNPKEWEVKKLKDVTDKILSGSTPKGGSKVYIENGITFLRSQNVWKNRLNLDDVVYIDKETHNKMIKSSLKYGDILMTKTGRINTENSSLGRAAIFRGKNDSANINGHVYLIRLQSDIINEFILFILTTDEYKEYIRSVCVGGIDKRQINKEHLEEFPIISPPVELQVQFSKLLTHLEKLKSEMRISLKELEDIFNSILQRAFKGELFQD